ncbi:hypothetical protein REPUB_Repub09cG0065300 [Reevesia pubescens]
MAEDLESFWNKLTLTKSKKVEFSIDQDWVEENVNDCNLSLAGKLSSHKITNITAMQSVLSQVWKVCYGTTIFGRVNNITRLDRMKWEYCPFWVQVFGLPVGLMIERIGIVIGDTLGDVLAVDATEN